MATAVLICLENTFWNRGDGNFVESFKKSFTLYVDSGMRKKAEAEIEKLRSENTRKHLASEDFEARFYKLIIEHCLCKIHCFYIHNTSNHFLCLNTAHSESESQAATGSHHDGGDQENYLG